MTITKHRWIVFKLACRAGIPWRGLVHDLSKYSPTEFWEGVKYYQKGKRSPILACIEENGYSKAKLHHLGRNKHHPAYWYDPFVRNSRPVIPYQYAVEMICDKIAASKTYIGKNWTTESPLNHWKTKEYREILNPKIDAMLTEVFTMIAVYGVNNVLKKSNLKELYNKHVYETEEKSDK